MTQTSATSSRQIKVSREVQARKAEVEKTIIGVLMRNADGRVWLWDQLSFCNVFQGDANLDPQYMAWQKGLRNYGLKLLNSIMRYEPALYIEMTKENSTVAAKEFPNGGSANDSDDSDSTLHDD